MKSLLIDNWTIQKAIANCDKENLSPEIKRIICYMVLWDDVYYLDNKNSKWWKLCVKNCEDLKFLKQLKLLCIPESDISMANQIYSEKFEKTKTEVVARGTLEYLIAANNYDAHYSPVDERTAFMEECDMFHSSFTRNEIIEKIDRDMLNYFKHSADIINAANLHLGMESIFALINKEKKCDISEQIKSFKKNNMIISFRKWVNKFENDIKKGRQLKVDQYLNELEEMQHTDPIKRLVNDTDIPSIRVKLPLSFLISAAKSFSPKFLFPSYIYKKGISHATEIVFHTRNNIDGM